MNSVRSRRERAARFDSVVLPVWSAKFLSWLLLAGALGLQWIATWQGVLRYDEPDPNTISVTNVQLRPELMELPGGTFQMGSPEGEAGRSPDETQRTVDVAPFAIFRTEVTLAQWEAVMGTRPNDCKHGCQDKHPVSNVSLLSAMQYANRLTEIENEWTKSKRTPCYREAPNRVWSFDSSCTGYRLPTEAEWEYAARASTTTPYSFETKDWCKYVNSKSWVTCNDQFESLAPVASFLPSPWGLFDMHGNVSEWVWGSDAKPTSSEPNNGGVLRGGSYTDEPANLRSAARDGVGTGLLDDGFRCIRSLP